MATITARVRAGARDGERPVGSVQRQHVILLIAATWMAFGGYIDGRAHETLPGLETFFTPWHAILYSGYVAAAAVLGLSALSSLRRTGSITAGLPDGWALSLAGVVLFGIGGVGDMLWHLVFGIEVGIEALLSPTHLLLAVGAALIATGPLRAAWRSSATTLPWTGAVSAALLLSSLSFMTVYSQPFGYVYSSAIPPRGDLGLVGSQVVGVTSILWHASVLVGLLLLLTRRFRVPVGTGTLLLVPHAVLLGFMEAFMWLVPAAIVSGIAIDLLLARFGGGNPREIRLLGVTAPVAIYAPYFVAVALAPGLAWSVDLWTGSIVLGSVVGVLASYLVAPPAAQSAAAPD
jgi:hypothetical protein